MTTAQALLEMTDRGAFEMLFRAVVEIREPRYRTLIRTGTNAQGESITSPVDGFSQLGDTKNAYAVVEVTTTDKKRLREKWLTGTKTEDADLLKASVWAEAIRKQQPDATFIVVLATNESPKPDLLKDVYTFGDTHDLRIDLWDNSRIEAVLDTTAEGQSVRQRYLGVSADLLSASLLYELGQTSLDRFACDLYDDPATLLVRDVVSQTIASLQAGKALAFLHGSSGVGKSTIAHHVMREWMGTGGFALRATAAQLARSASVDSLLHDILTDLHPNGLINATSTLRKLLDRRRRLLLVIDDLRQESNAAALARQLLTWSQPPKDVEPEIVFIVPVHPQAVAAIATERERAEWLEILEVGRFTREESTAYLRLRTGVDAYADEIAQRLGDDPFQTGRYVQLVERGNSPTIDLADDVIETFITNELTERAVDDLDPAELDNVITRLARMEMEQRRLTMPVSQIPERDRPALRALVPSRLLVYRIDAKGQKSIAFAHDRLQEHFFARAARGMFNDQAAEDVLRDPYFARVVGMALATTEDADAIIRLRELAPLAIFEALRFVRQASASLPALLREAEAYLESAHVASELERMILQALFEASVDGLLPIARRLPDSWLRQLVLARHGDLAGGLAYAIHTPLSSSNSMWREAIVRARPHHPRLVDELAKTLETANTDVERRAALVVAGTLGTAALAPAIRICWQNIESHETIAHAAVWAAARCANDENAEAILGPPLTVLLTVEGESDDDLRFAFAHAPTPAACRFFIDYGRANGKTAPILWILQASGDPAVFEEFVCHAANRPNPVWETIFCDLWTPTHRFGRAPSRQARLLLQSIWQDDARNIAERRAAFNVWSRSADSRDTPLLRSISPNSKLHRSAVLARAKLHDNTAAPQLAALANDDSDCLRHAPLIWSEELRDRVDTRLAQVVTHFASGTDCRCNDCHQLSAILRNIPVADAESLLDRHWSGLAQSSLFIKTAVAVGTQKTLCLADEAVAAADPTADLFRHGFASWDLPKDRLTLFLRYKSRLTLDQLRSIVATASRNGWRDWIEQHFEEVATALPPKDAASLRSVHFPSDEDLRNELREHFAFQFSGHSAARELQSRSMERVRVLRIAIDVAGDVSTRAAWETALALIFHLATRSDLDWLRSSIPDEYLDAFDDMAFAIRRRSLT